MKNIEKQIIVEAKNLAVGYKNKILCQDINFQLYKGQIIALMGVNGSGKSTLMKTMVGLIPAISGDVFYHDIPLKNYSRLMLAQIISVVLTDSVSTLDMTVFETVSFGRYPHTNWLGKLSDNDRFIINQSLAEVGLSGFDNRQLATLSDGEMQRVMIARALAQQTDILFLDEPASHLDIPNKAMIISLLKDLAVRKNKTIIYSTHEISFIKKAADFVWIFDQFNDFKVISPNDGFSSGLFETIFKESFDF